MCEVIVTFHELKCGREFSFTASGIILYERSVRLEKNGEIQRSKPKRCFIAASIGTDISVLQQIFRERSIETVVPDSLRQHGSSYMDNFVKAIKKVDFVVAVLEADRTRQNIYFELGCAFALGKELVFVSPIPESVPFDFREFLYIRSSAKDRDALVFAFDQYLSRRGSPPDYPQLFVDLLA